MEDARTRVALLHKANAAYGLHDFLAAFQLDEPGTTHFGRAAGLIGLK
jgi:hypothetical protein